MSSSRFPVLASIGLVAALTVCTVAEAQRGGGTPGQRSGFERIRQTLQGRLFGGSLALLQREDVQKELGVTESQLKEITDVVQASRDQARPGFGSFRGMSGEERQQAFTEMREQREQRQQELKSQIDRVLDASQRTRLSQLEFQFSLQRGDLASALEAAGVAVSDSDREKLQEALEAAIQKARMDALATVIDAAQITRLMGEPFTFESGPGFAGRRGGQSDAPDGGPPTGRAQPAGASDNPGADEPATRRSRRDR